MNTKVHLAVIVGLSLVACKPRTESARALDQTGVTETVLQYKSVVKPGVRGGIPKFSQLSTDGTYLYLTQLDGTRVPFHKERAFERAKACPNDTSASYTEIFTSSRGEYRIVRCFARTELEENYVMVMHTYYDGWPNDIKVLEDAAVPANGISFSLLATQGARAGIRSFSKLITEGDKLRLFAPDGSSAEFHRENAYETAKVCPGDTQGHFTAIYSSAQSDHKIARCSVGTTREQNFVMTNLTYDQGWPANVVVVGVVQGTAQP